MGTLILVKHALPEIREDVPSPDWVLSQEGREASRLIGERLRGHGVGRIFSSPEPKAFETARIAASALGAPLAVHNGLHENDRTGLGFQSRDKLEARIRAFFDNPTHVVMGKESAADALARFSSAIEDVLREGASANAAVVAHGTVITLFVARHNPVAPFDFWKALSLPSFVLLVGPGFAFDGIVHGAERSKRFGLDTESA